MERPLQKFFGYSTFRPLQKEVVVEILQGKDCLVLLASGGGKSICYQLPALITKKTAVVISPLYSLMQDQVASLQKRGIRAEYMCSAQTDGTVPGRAEGGEIDILYMTPEKACSVSERFWEALMRRGVSLLAVDEAHCISEWGHDFRRDYRNLGGLRRHLPKVPFVALTATVTHNVREDIVHSLQLQNFYTALSSLDRPNIFYGVKFLNNQNVFLEELVKVLSDDVVGQGSTIIYCTSVKMVEKVVEVLRYSKFDARAYHAKMLYQRRREVHRAFSNDEIQIVVATIAFGMGIDKQNVRQVIHYGCPKSLEAYCQESGRCGRDGLPSRCWLYYRSNDFMRGKLFVAESSNEERKAVVKEAYTMAQNYCSTVACRRRTILEYFDETVTSKNCENCDNCLKSESSQSSNFPEEAGLLITAVMSCGQNFGFRVPIDVLRGSLARKVLENGFNSLPIYGLGRERSVKWWWSLGDQLLAHGHFEAVFQSSFRLIRVTEKGLQNMWSAERITFQMSDETAHEEEQQRKVAVPQVLSRNSMVETTETAGSVAQLSMALVTNVMWGRTEATRSTASIQDVPHDAMVETLEAALSATTEQSSNSTTSDSQVSEWVPRAFRTAVKRKRISELSVIQSMGPSDIGGSSKGRSSIRAAQMRFCKKSNDFKDALHRIAKNGLYILCSETQEIIDPHLLESPSLLMAALHLLEMKDQLYERIGRAYGMWLLAAPIKRPRCEPELSQVMKIVESFKKQAAGASNVIARASELLQFREYLESLSCPPIRVYRRRENN